MGKAKSVLEALGPLDEAAIPFDQFKVALASMKTRSPGKTGQSYTFKLPAAMAQRDLFNHLMEEIHNLPDHASYLDIQARINSDRDQDDAYLWDPGIEIQGDEFLVDGHGEPSGGGGHALIGYDQDGKITQVHQDELKGKHIEPDHGELEKIEIVNCSPDLYRLLKQAFGPSGESE